jgi:fructose-1,6-bisphosphatase II
MDRKLVLEYVRVTEAAAIACAAQIGRGDKHEADRVAVEAMRQAFDRVPARGTVVIGEGEMDEAPMLYIGERVGPDDASLPEVDIAIDPLEGTTLCAKAMPGAITVLAVAGKGGLLAAPDVYMDKIAAGPAGRGVVSLAKSVERNVLDLAEAKGVRPADLTVVMLERPRHAELLAGLRRVGARVQLISDGDVAPAVATAFPESGVDLVIGVGGAPEGVLAAAALHALGGEFQGRLQFADEGERARARTMMAAAGRGDDPDRVLALDDLVRGDVIFCATGVTTAPFLRGVRRVGDRLHLHSVALRASTGTVRHVETAVDLRRVRPQDA